MLRISEEEGVGLHEKEITDLEHTAWKENVGFTRSISMGVPKLGMGAGHRIFGCREGMFVALNLSTF